MTQPSQGIRRARRFAFTAVIAAVITVIGVPAGLGFATTYRLLYSSCDAASTTPGDFGLAWEDLTLTAQAGGDFRAFFIPGTNRAAIIIPPTTNDGRGDRLDLAAMLAQHGYAVMTFESRRCAGMGPLSLGYQETDEVGDVLTYLQTRPDIDPDRIGITGFSSAGATAIMSAARFPELRAVIAEGGYGDFSEGVVGLRSGDDTWLETLYKQSLRLSYHLITGIDIDKLSPVDVIGQIAPRPILLIYGSRERSLEGARQQLAAAGDNAQLWIVEGARHGTYRADVPAEYEDRVIAFFDRALLSKGLTS
jgi:dipeptidyl aminopeptidase/acylaminoacyl peptidase